MSSLEGPMGGSKYPWVLYPQGEASIDTETQVQHATASLKQCMKKTAEALLKQSEQEQQYGKRHHHIIFCPSTHSQGQVSKVFGGAGDLSFTVGRNDFDVLRLGDVAVSDITDKVDIQTRQGSEKCWGHLYRTHDDSKHHYVYGMTIHHIWIISIRPCILVWPSVDRYLHPLVIHGFEDLQGERLVTVQSKLEEAEFGELEGVKFSNSMANNRQTSPPLNNSNSWSPDASHDSTRVHSSAGSRPSSGNTGEVQQQGVDRSGKSENNPHSTLAVKPDSNLLVNLKGFFFGSKVTAGQPHHLKAGTRQLDSNSPTQLQDVNQPIGGSDAGHHSRSSEHGRSDKKKWRPFRS